MSSATTTFSEDIAIAFRSKYLQELWQSLGGRCQGKPVAIYGAGEHTSYMLDLLVQVKPKPDIAFILDDSSDAPKSVNGVPVVSPQSVDPQKVGAVVVSSDVIEDKLAKAAEAWASNSASTTPPEIIRLYANLPAGPYPRPGDTTFKEAALSPHDYMPVNPHATVLRLDSPPARTPENAPATPPAAMRAGYPRNDERYLADGKMVNDSLRALLAEFDKDVSSFSDILEWGCSTGRVLRHWNDLAHDMRVWGCDIDANSVEWCVKNLASPFRFFQATTRPSLPIPDNTFDFIYGISIFTHISELIESWLLELRRITKPGGIVVVTVHDERSWDRCATQDTNKSVARLCPDIDFSSPMDCDFVAQGRERTKCTFWRTDAIRERWSLAFDILDIRPEFANFRQSAVIMRPSK